VVIDPSVITAIAVVTFSVAILIVLFIPVQPRKVRDTSLLYQDRHIEIYPDRFILNGYYFGPFGRKHVPLSRLERLDIVALTLWTGKYRLQGTGDFRTWFPQDLRRPRRKSAFVASLRGKRMKIGFTVEDFERVRQIFSERGWLKEQT